MRSPNYVSVDTDDRYRLRSTRPTNQVVENIFSMIESMFTHHLFLWLGRAGEGSAREKENGAVLLKRSQNEQKKSERCVFLCERENGILQMF